MTNLDIILENDSDHKEYYDEQGNLVCGKCGIIMEGKR
jgi:transcription initiation factor TFIIIB Brf1 subunit/transcription initiation factor TFIIB